MDKKKINIKFVDFWSGFVDQDNFIYKTLSKKYEVIISDSPDYLFYSTFGYEYLKYDCIRIFFTGENIRPDFNLCDYAIGFDYMQFEDRYLRYPQFMIDEYQREREIIKHKQVVDEVGEKKFCNFIYSNGDTNCPREDFFYLLSKYKQVDSGGRYLNNIAYRVEDKLAWQQEYKFTIAFENSYSSGYVTEKILQAFAAGTIPIYWGAPNVMKDFNEKAFINCNNYESFEEVVQKVIELDTDEQKYLSMLNEPVFTKLAEESYLQEDYLKEFLCHIMDQDVDHARRILRQHTWSRISEFRLSNHLKYIELLQKVHRKNRLCRYILKKIMGTDGETVKNDIGNKLFERQI